MTTLKRTPTGHQSYQFTEIRGASTCHCTGQTEPTQARPAVLSEALARNPEAHWPWPLLTNERKYSLLKKSMEFYKKKLQVTLSKTGKGKPDGRQMKLLNSLCEGTKTYLFHRIVFL